MRLDGNSENRLPVGLVAVVIFIVLLALVQLLNRQYATPTAGLQQQFAASPPAPNAGQIELPAIPTNLAGLARTTAARIMGGLASRPLDSTGRNAAMQVDITNIQPVDGGLHLTGSVTNISAAPLEVTLDSFKFTDAGGTVYASSGSPPTTLQARQTAPLDITLPVKDPSLLKLQVAQSGQEPIDMVLLNAGATPTAVP